MLPGVRFNVLHNLRTLPSSTPSSNDDFSDNNNDDRTEEVTFVVGYGGCIGLVGRDSRRQIWVGERNQEVSVLTI